MKVVFVDYSVFVHRAIFWWRTSDKKFIPATAMGWTMIHACLMRVGLRNDDLVIFAADSPLGSWRRDVDPSYKADRRAKRNKFADINWEKHFYEFAQLANSIEAATPFYFVEVDKLEADDIIAYGTKHFDRNRCIIISTDSDFEMLAARPNVQILSPITKRYKQVKNPYKLLASKIKKEATDNLTSPILTVADYERRNKIVNLIELPPEIEVAVAEAFTKLDYNKTYDPCALMHGKKTFERLFHSDKVIKVKPLKLRQRKARVVKRISR